MASGPVKCSTVFLNAKDCAASAKWGLAELALNSCNVGVVMIVARPLLFGTYAASLEEGAAEEASAVAAAGVQVTRKELFAPLLVTALL